MRPIRIPRKIALHLHSPLPPVQRIALIKEAYGKLRKQGKPLASVVVPAYKKETLLPLLHSLSLNQSKHAVEIVAVNNHAADRTEEWVCATGVRCVNEPAQGLTAARNAGLKAAEGKYVLNADAGSVYPPTWIDCMIDPMEKDKAIVVTYGNYAFLPAGAKGRCFYFFCEQAADAQRWYKRRFREEAVNVSGCNLAYRRQEGLSVQGYHHPQGAKDGYLALKLRNAGYGRLHFVGSNKALVWTPGSLIQNEGNIGKSLPLRVKKNFFSPAHVQMRTDLQESGTQVIG